MNNKYELLPIGGTVYHGSYVYDTTHPTMPHLYRIRRLSDGLIGGWIEGEHNLSIFDDCFIYNESVVCDGSFVTLDARVHGKSIINNHSHISNESTIWDSVINHSHVHDNSYVEDSNIIDSDLRDSVEVILSTITNQNLSGNQRINGQQAQVNSAMGVSPTRHATATFNYNPGSVSIKFDNTGYSLKQSKEKRCDCGAIHVKDAFHAGYCSMKVV